MGLGGIRTLGTQIAFGTSVLIVAVGVAIIWQIDGILSSNEENRAHDQLMRARMQLEQQLGTDLDLSVTGAKVLAAQTDMRNAILQGDPAAVLRVATDYSARVGTPLQGTPGLQVYDVAGNLIVRAHDPLRGREDRRATIVDLALESGAALSAFVDDELLGVSLAGVAPVLDDAGNVIGAVETLTGLDSGFVFGQEALLGTVIILMSAEGIRHSDAIETEIESLDLTPEQIAQATDDTASIEFGSDPHLATRLVLTDVESTPVAEVYLGIDETEISRGVDAVRGRAFRATAIGGVIAILLAFVIAFLAVRPIRHLVISARRLQTNDLDTEIDIHGSTEAIELGEALDDLRISLRQTRDAMFSANRDLASRFDASNASLSEASQDLAVMHRVLAALGGDAPGGLPGVADELRELDWVDGVVIVIATETGRLSLAASSGIRREAAETLLLTIEAGLHGQRIEAGMVVADTSANSEVNQLASMEIGGFGVQPMVEPDGVVGVVAVTSRGPMRLMPTRIELLRSVAREIAVMLERTELAGEVEENRRIAESVLREMSDGLLVINHANQCRVVNPAAARLLGRSRADLLDQSAEQCLPLDRDSVATLRRRAQDPARAPAAPLLAEVNGRKLAISAGPFVDVDPERSGMMVLLRDLSAEAEADRVKQDFVSMVGHELRTPLTLIRTTIDLLHEGDAGSLSPTQERIVEVLHANTDRLMTLINDLLDMSAIDSGRMQITPQPVNVSEVIREVVQENQDAAMAKQHHLVLDAPENAPAMVDRKRLTQILSNLIGNAIKYTPMGGTITARAQILEQAVQISVSDNGIGIPPEEQTQLFEKFYRTSAGRRTTGGTGLGLAIARSLVEMHGGRIWCDSDGQNGTTFTFTLPRRQI